MLTLTKFNSIEKLEFKNSTELKQMLKFCNPTMLRFYKQQIENKKFDGLDFYLKIYNMGESIEIIRDSR